MRQIGARQEAGKVGGIGSCGRELCCSTWLTDFKSVNTAAARYQNLSINQTKLSGQCGRLKCCLNYELDTYLDALQHFPDNCDVLQVAKGNAFLIKKDIFKNLMWYTLPDSNKQYPLSIDRVKKIKELNRQGVRPEELEPVEIVSSKPKEEEPEFVELVGQISLKSLDRAAQKKRRQQQGPRPDQPRREGGAPQRNQPQRGPQQRGPQQGGSPQARPPQGGSAQNGNAPRSGGPSRQQPRGPRSPRGPRPPQQGSGN
jgi:hypothetical protein